MSRASVHNISIMEELKLGVGDEIEVYKANMIIPQIARNLTKSGVKDIPKRCPVCGGETKIKQAGNAKALYCLNEDCQAKHVKAFALFVSRDAPVSYTHLDVYKRQRYAFVPDDRDFEKSRLEKSGKGMGRK